MGPFQSEALNILSLCSALCGGICCLPYAGAVPSPLLAIPQPVARLSWCRYDVVLKPLQYHHASSVKSAD